MLIEQNSHLYTYSITRDLGFAPNPFHGICTLATCKPRVRSAAKVGDWIMGVGGSTLGAVAKKCIFLMKVSKKIDFQEYWTDPAFVYKKAVRNGSRVQMLGDNIYHLNGQRLWIQEDSHHSNSDGTPNLVNLERDTGTSDQVLISNYFLYFGSEAIDVNLESINYIRIRDFKKTCLTSSEAGRALIESVVKSNRSNINLVVANPVQFKDSHKRVSQDTGKLI